MLIKTIILKFIFHELFAQDMEDGGKKPAGICTSRTVCDIYQPLSTIHCERKVGGGENTFCVFSIIIIEMCFNS